MRTIDNLDAIGCVVLWTLVYTNLDAISCMNSIDSDLLQYVSSHTGRIDNPYRG